MAKVDFPELNEFINNWEQIKILLILRIIFNITELLESLSTNQICKHWFHIGQ